MTKQEMEIASSVKAIPKALNGIEKALKDLNETLKKLDEQKYLRIEWPKPEPPGESAPETQFDHGPFEKAPWWLNPSLPRNILEPWCGTGTRQELSSTTTPGGPS